MTTQLESNQLRQRLRGDAPDKWNIPLSMLSAEWGKNVVAKLDQDKADGQVMDEEEEADLRMLAACAQLCEPWRKNEEIQRHVTDVRQYFLMAIAARYFVDPQQIMLMNEFYVQNSTVPVMTGIAREKDFVLDGDKIALFENCLNTTNELRQQGIAFGLPPQEALQGFDSSDLLDFAQYILIRDTVMHCLLPLQPEERPTPLMDQIGKDLDEGGAVSVLTILKAYKADHAPPVRKMPENRDTLTRPLFLQQDMSRDTCVIERAPKPEGLK
jgi:hypothetical protein